MEVGVLIFENTSWNSEMFPIAKTRVAIVLPSEETNC